MHIQKRDNVDPAVHDNDEDNDDNEMLYHFPYSRESGDCVLPDIDDVHDDQHVDPVLHLSSMEVDSV